MLKYGRVWVFKSAGNVLPAYYSFERTVLKESEKL